MPVAVKIVSLFVPSVDYNFIRIVVLIGHIANVGATGNRN